MWRGGTPQRTSPLGIDLVALVRGKRNPQQGAVGVQDLRVTVPEAHGQEGAALDVGVQHCEGAARQLRYRYAPLRPLRAMTAYVPSFSHSVIKIPRGLMLALT